MVIMSSCSQEESISSPNLSPSERIDLAMKKIRAEMAGELDDRAKGVQERGLAPAEEGSCNCYIRLNGIDISYPSANLNSENAQFILQAGSSNEICPIDESTGVQCPYFKGSYDPFVDTNCSLGIPAECDNDLNYGGVGSYAFNCNVPLYSTLFTELYAIWTDDSNGDCMNGALESVTLSLSVVCAYSGKVNSTNNSGCDNVYTNQASTNAIKTFTLAVNSPYDGTGLVFPLIGCGCDF